jgi:hypothetical protein
VLGVCAFMCAFVCVCFFLVAGAAGAAAAFVCTNSENTILERRIDNTVCRFVFT